MGKQKRSRQKFHNSTKEKTDEGTDLSMDTSNPLLLQPTENIFKDINIDFNILNKKLNDDTVSVKSFKSLKQEGGNKALSKKEKLMLRKKMLLQKIDTVNQLLKDKKMRKRRKKIAIIGDTNPLHDALPSLDLLLKQNHTTKNSVPSKLRGIQKAKKRKLELKNGVQLYKKLLNLDKYKKDPQNALSEHIKNVVNNLK